MNLHIEVIQNIQCRIEVHQWPNGIVFIQQVNGYWEEAVPDPAGSI